MLQQIVRFADDTAGLEKTLRLLQSFCTIAVGLSTTAEDLALWVKLRAQFALGRRYFRLLKWHPCWSNASNALHAQQGTPLRTALDVVKWSFLGMYFFLEMFTISNAMGATAFEWGPKVQMEANRCWFFALVTSIVLSLHEILLYQMASSSTSVDVVASEKTNGHAKSKEAAKPTSTKKGQSPPSAGLIKIYSQLVIDSCDIFIPGAAVGWIPVGPLVVGIASTISTTLAGAQIWQRVQQKTKQE